MSARRTKAASPSASSAWWRSIAEATAFGRPQRRASTPPTSAWSTPSSRRSRWMRSSGVRASPWTWPRVARVGVHQHELADVVQQRGDQQAVAVLVAGLGGEAVGGALGGDGVQAEALGRGVPAGARSKKSKVRGAGGERLDGLGREHLDGLDDRLDLAAGACPRPGWRGAGRRSRARRRTRRRRRPRRSRCAPRATSAQQAVARLGQRREGLERLERGGQATAVALVVAALGAERRRRRRGGWARRWRQCGVMDRSASRALCRSCGG